MELRHLRYFLAVAEELHFGRAALRLQMAQPPLSQQIKQLEAELGVQLFSRTRRRVALTAAGVVFQQEVELLLAQLQQAVAKTQRADRGAVGSLAIAFVSSAMYSLLPEGLQRFRQHYPQVNIVLHELSTQEQIQGLFNNQLDIGFVRPPIDQEKLQTQSVLQESLVAALPAHHPLAGRPSIAISDLQTEAFVLFPRPKAVQLYDQIVNLCHQGGFSPNVVQQAAQMQTILSLVTANLGVAIVPESLQNLQRRGVCFVPFTQPTPQAEVCMVWRQDQPTPVVETFVAEMLQLPKERLEPGGHGMPGGPGMPPQPAG
ncbi:LysR substrate-binding domain-containing protein [Leptothoe kymatousa]|uniref:LysR family transcriptional regulator n=1 Tax=Leptothoe kymatousa TAU-MAC 1615 TaxID=2364775 RepID=A0ABS5XZM4_9CYAN|nr:LysR substrate-binding domain-containing protein [Leptothoe kymatousa]MBT9310693.1 LysR family transcriptional regulator [Leptothoe kymatousa TAU-MAC 1615]